MDGMPHAALVLLAQASPLVLAALGGLLSEYAGALNIGLEGIMLGGAFVAVACPLLVPLGWAAAGAGIVLAAATGWLWGTLMAQASLRWRANVFIVGLAVNLLAAGLVTLAGKLVFGNQSLLVWTGAWPPDLGRALFAGLALAATAGVWATLRLSRTGLRLRVLGSDEDMLLARGIDTVRLKRRALQASGALAGLAGAALSLGLGSYVPNMSAGKGWIALVLIFVGMRHPLGTAAACVAFALAEDLALGAQGQTAAPALLVGLPYALVLAALVAAQGLRRRR